MFGPDIGNLNWKSVQLNGTAADKERQCDTGWSQLVLLTVLYFWVACCLSCQYRFPSCPVFTSIMIRSVENTLVLIFYTASVLLCKKKMIGLRLNLHQFFSFGMFSIKTHFNLLFIFAMFSNHIINKQVHIDFPRTVNNL